MVGASVITIISDNHQRMSSQMRKLYQNDPRGCLDQVSQEQNAVVPTADHKLSEYIFVVTKHVNECDQLLRFANLY